MKKFLILLLLALSLDTSTYIPPSRPAIKITQEDRQQNWLDFFDQGSCVHASMVMLLRYQGRDDAADWWLRNFAGGEKHHTFISKLEFFKVPYATTFRRNDVAFLEWAIKINRGCMVTTGRYDKDLGRIRWGNHMIVLVHIDAAEVALIDSNNPNKLIWMDREQFLKEWSLSNSWATTVLLSTPRAP